MSVMLDTLMSNNFHSVTLGNVTLYFSYHTCIGVDDGKNVSVRANEWGTTTGKHINYLKNNFGSRVNSGLTEGAFQTILDKVLHVPANVDITRA